MKRVWVVLIGLLEFSLATKALAEKEADPLVYTARYEESAAGTRQLLERSSENTALAGEKDLIEFSYPQHIIEHQPLGPRRIVVLKSRKPQLLEKVLRERQVKTIPATESINETEAADEVVTLVEHGPVKNRLDLVFMGDGYTKDERQKFFADIQRLVSDLFKGETFRAYLPLFNVHAVFRASHESGIGYNDRPKDTAYGLFREGTSLRAIFTAKPDAARASCRAAPGCDYPILIANDPYYGGLGGEFAISTSSVTSGSIVLRHELGHNFGRVGEEYDGGGYYGANFSPSLASLKWQHWASEIPVKAQPAVARFLDWPWHNLAGGPYEAHFRSDGTYAKAAVRFSASGFNAPHRLSLTLDGQPQPFISPHHDDRSFYNLFYEQGFASGSHTFAFRKEDHTGESWVSSLSIHEFGEGYRFEPDFIGAYPVFSKQNQIEGYRSNHDACLMRNMQSARFCAVCQENQWLKFLEQISLIDDVEMIRSSSEIQVRLHTQKLGPLYPQAGDDSRLAIRWFHNDEEVAAWRDQFSWNLPLEEAKGRWSVEVTFITSQVRRDPEKRLQAKRSFTI